jgi:Zinc-ribbon containing domain
MSNRLIKAYKEMLERVKESELPIKKAIEQARKKAVDLGELSAEESHQIAGYLKRDLSTVGQYLEATGKALGDWLGFDWDLAEQQLIDLFLSIADKTQLEWVELQHDLKLGPIYHAGEIIGIGTLRCTQCGKKQHFYEVGVIPPCPHCENTEFLRVTR